MIVKTALRYSIGVAILTTAAAVAVVALAFAFYAALSPLIGSAWAAAALAGAAAALMAIAGFFFFFRKPGADKRQEDEGLAAKLIALGREKPLIAAAFAVAAGVIAIRNPTLLSALLGAVIARESVPPKKKKR